LTAYRAPFACLSLNFDANAGNRQSVIGVLTMKYPSASAPICAAALAVALWAEPSFAQDLPADAPQAWAEDGQQDFAVSDPFEPWNRRMFAIHEGIDRFALEPAARGYRAVTPRWARQGVSNALRNVRAPVILANDLLQGEFSRAGVTTARFGLNSTFGLFGLVDVAEDMGFERHDEDFGQTLAAWGIEPGPYIFVPVLGPTTLRDGFGRGVDNAFDPITYADFEEVDDVRATRGALTGLAVRENLLDPIDAVRETAIDPYVAIRTQYAYARRDAVNNGAATDETLPQFDEIPDALRQPAEELPQEQTPLSPETAP
jgi:phospholipid-binding lipoprotein MlaA